MSSDPDNPKIQIFISYGHGDEIAVALANKISQFLEEKGYSTWLDTKNGVPPGSEFNISIEIGIKQSSIFLAILSRWSLRDEGFCRNEILYAKFLNKPIMPVRIENREPPLEIIALNFLDCASNPDEIFALLPEAIQKIKIAKNLGYRAFEDMEASGWWIALKPLSFDEELARYGGPFRGRNWFIDKIRDWVKKTESRMLLVTAHAGVGKSVIASHLQTCMNVKGIHFCSYSNAPSCSSGMWLGSIIFQLASQFPLYRENIRSLEVPALSHPDPSLFRIYVTDPLFKCRMLEKSDEPWIFVIDGLDEAIAKNGFEFLNFLVAASERIPPWMRIIVFSRPHQDCINRLTLKNIDHFILSLHDPLNREDLGLYIKSRIQLSNLSITPEIFKTYKINPCPRQNEIIQKILGICDGNFLYAHLLLDALEDPNPKTGIDPKEIGHLPSKITGMYSLMFSRRFDDPTDYRLRIRPLLLPLVVAREPLPDSLLRRASNLGLEFEDAFSRVSQFLEGGSEGRVLFHRSLLEWLVDADHQSGFYIDPSEGQKILAEACLSVLKNGSKKSPSYVFRHLLFHLIEANAFDAAQNVLLDPMYLQAAWDISEFSVKTALMAFEKSSDLTVKDVFLQVVQSPENYPTPYLSIIAQILMDSGFLDDSCCLLHNVIGKTEIEGDDIVLQEFFGMLSWALYLKGSIKEAFEASLRQQEICMRIGDDDGLQRAFHHLGNILLDQGEYEKAHEFYYKAAEICERIKNPYWLQKSLGNQGLVYYHRGELDKALELFVRQDTICQEIGHIEGRVKSAGNRGNIFYINGDFDEALSYYNNQERLAQSIGYPRGIMYALGNQGLVFLGKENFKNAYERFNSQRKLAEKMGSKEGLQSSLGNLGLFEQKRGRLEKAENYFQEQLRICREIENKDGEQAALGRLANNAVLQGNRIKAHDMYCVQEEICRKLSKPDWLQGCLGNQGVLLTEEKKYDEAFPLFTEQEIICRRLPNLDGLKRCLCNKGLLFLKKGDTNSAIGCFEEQVDLCEQLKNEQDLKQASDYLFQLYLQTGNEKKILAFIKKGKYPVFNKQ